MQTARGLRLIVAYKLAKAALQAVAAVAIGLAVQAGWAERLAGIAMTYSEHALHPTAIRLARWLSLAVTPRHLEVLALLLAGDALVSAGEGWVLRRGYAWGRWLVVVATGSLLPFELYELIEKPRVGRALVLLINAAIVGYLAWDQRKRARGVLPQQISR